MPADAKQGLQSEGVQILSEMPEIGQVIDTSNGILRVSDADTPACCAPSFASSLPKERYALPGYGLTHFVTAFIETDVGLIPLIDTRLHWKDRRSTFAVRAGIGRDRYQVSPGIYGVGRPDANSEVLVTANFKLSFDLLRRELKGVNAWILVLDTRGVNVWCAAGKGRFGTRELIERVHTSELSKLVKHRRLIVPQLGATGIRAGDVKKAAGFRVIFGPIRSKDISAFLKNGRKATPEMRQVTFSFQERLILTPIELKGALKPVLITMLVLFLLSGIAPGFFSRQAAWERGIPACGFLFAGVFTGAVVTPALLPFIPFRCFAAKGLLTGAVFFIYLLWALQEAGFFFNGFAVSALFLFTAMTTSNLAMNFTGATPFTSPSGVEKEMKIFIPLQAGGILVSSMLWIASAF